MSSPTAGPIRCCWQVEGVAGDGTVSANDVFRPVSRYFDRIARPEQLIPALRRTMQVLTDPAECGPVTLALCQDVQAEAFDYPAEMFEDCIVADPRPPSPRRRASSQAAVAAICMRQAEAGDHRRRRRALFRGGRRLRAFAERHGIPVMETQGGKSTLPHDHPLNMGSVGALPAHRPPICSPSNRTSCWRSARGCRTSPPARWALFQGRPGVKIIGLNVQPFDAGKHRALPLVADAQGFGLDLLDGKAPRRTGRPPRR